MYMYINSDSIARNGMCLFRSMRIYCHWKQCQSFKFYCRLIFVIGNLAQMYACVVLYAFMEQ